VASPQCSHPPNPVESTVNEMRNRDIAKPTFTVQRPKRREQGHAKDALAIRTPQRPSTADPPRPRTSDSTASSQGKSQRRKSYMGQSIHNMRKSVTDAIKGRPRSSGVAAAHPALISRTHNASQFPPSPTLPLSPSSTLDPHRQSLGFSARRRN
jgi:hypothetical protein